MYCTLPKYHEHFKETLFSECNCGSSSVLPHRNETVSHPENTAKVMSLSKGTRVLTQHISASSFVKGKALPWGIQPKLTCRWGLLFPLSPHDARSAQYLCGDALSLFGSSVNTMDVLQDLLGNCSLDTRTNSKSKKDTHSTGKKTSQLEKFERTVDHTYSVSFPPTGQDIWVNISILGKVTSVFLSGFFLSTLSSFHSTLIQFK